MSQNLPPGVTGNEPEITGEIGVAATGGTNEDGTRWISYAAGDWDAVAQELSLAGWSVYLIPKDETAKMLPIVSGVWIQEAQACAVAEAVAKAVRHVASSAPKPPPICRRPGCPSVGIEESPAHPGEFYCARHWREATTEGEG